MGMWWLIALRKFFLRIENGIIVNTHSGRTYNQYMIREHQKKVSYEHMHIPPINALLYSLEGVA